MLDQQIIYSGRSASEIIDSIIEVTAHADRDRLKTALVSTIHELLPIDQVALFEFLPNEQGIDVLMEFKMGPDGLEKGGLCRAGNLTNLRNIPIYQSCLASRDEVMEPAGDGRFRYARPVIDAKDSVVGVVEFFGRELGGTDRYLLTALLRLYHNYLRILDESEKDSLTGLLNRRTFDRNLVKILDEEGIYDDSGLTALVKGPMRRCRSDDCRNWLAVIDVDHFKRINDNYGHLYGDEVLLLLSGVMRHSFRAYDKLFRFGGEEFVIVLKETDERCAVRALERFRSAVQSFDFPQVGTVTISIGYVEVLADDMPTEVVARADEALYYAKSNGRNQIQSYSELVAAGKLKRNRHPNSNAVEIF